MGVLIFDKAPFPSCHASTVVETKPGHLMAAWFGGTAEKANDVQIWGSHFDGKSWTAPEVLGTQPNQPCWNPVLFQLAKGPLMLWYKVGPNPTNWVGVERKSEDNGKTWSKPVFMPAGFYGPVRAKPIQLKDGTLLAGTSVEAGQDASSVWTPFVDRSPDNGATWIRSNAYHVPNQHGQIQPTLLETKEGHIVALMRSRKPLRVCRSVSQDGGKTFSAAEPIELPNPNAGIDVVKTTEGDLFLIHNPVERGRSPLSLARSTDDGKTWKNVHDLETEPKAEFSYPAMIQSHDGKLHMTYTWKRRHIKHETIDPKTLRG
jgi:predicted neuraminidase